MKEAVKSTLGGVTIIIVIVAWLFGAEPQLLDMRDMCYSAMSFGDYLAGTVEREGNSIPVKVIAAIAYPGARAGAWVHNQTWGRKACKTAPSGFIQAEPFTNDIIGKWLWLEKLTQIGV